MNSVFKFLSTTLAIAIAVNVFTGTANAQHGGVNGPHQDGSIIPASGNQEITRVKLERAFNECYLRTLKETLTQLIGITPQTSISSTSLNDERQYIRADWVYVRDAVMQASQFCKTYHCNVSSSMFADIVAYGSREAKTPKPLRLSIDFDNFDLPVQSPQLRLTAWLPSFSWTESEKPFYDPNTGATLGKTIFVSALRSVIHSSVDDLSAIPVYDQSSQQITKFTLNGQSFISCVQSQL